MSNPKILIAGIGKLGKGLALKLRQKGIDVTGIRRNTNSVPEGITAFAADLSDKKSLEVIKREWDIVIYIVAAKTFDESEYRQAYVDNLKNLLSVIDIAEGGRLIFVSSSSVYGQNDGSWVDEESQTLPQSFNGRVMLEAETLALQTKRATVVRFSGIYGSNRTRVVDHLMEGKVAPLTPVIYSNRIHEEDCVGVLEFLVLRLLNGQILDNIYVASDCEPAPLAVIQRWIASQLRIKDELNEQPERGRLAGSKRLSNQRLLNSGYKFIYPNYRNGYRAILDENKT